MDNIEQGQIPSDQGFIKRVKTRDKRLLLPTQERLQLDVAAALMNEVLIRISPFRSDLPEDYFSLPLHERAKLGSAGFFLPDQKVAEAIIAKHEIPAFQKLAKAKVEIASDQAPNTNTASVATGPITEPPAGSKLASTVAQTPEKLTILPPEVARSLIEELQIAKDSTENAITPDAVIISAIEEFNKTHLSKATIEIGKAAESVAAHINMNTKGPRHILIAQTHFQNAVAAISEGCNILIGKGILTEEKAAEFSRKSIALILDTAVDEPLESVPEGQGEKFFSLLAGVIEMAFSQGENVQRM